MNKKYLFSLLGLVAYSAITASESQNLLPEGWNSASFSNYFEKIKSIAGEFEASTVQLEELTTTTEGLHTNVNAVHAARNAKLDCIKQELTELYNCVQTCNSTHASLQAQYTALTNQIAADQAELEGKITAIDAEITSLSNLLTTLDEATTTKALEAINDLNTAKEKFYEQVEQKNLLAEKLTTLKGSIDAMHNTDYVSEIQTQLESDIGLDCSA